MFMLVNWVLESLMTIIKFTSIQTPRKEFEDYEEGDEVRATYQGKQYPAMIIKKSESQKVLVETMDSILEEQRKGATMESILTKRKKEGPSKSPKKRKQTKINIISKENDIMETPKKRKQNEDITATACSSTSTGQSLVSTCPEEPEKNSQIVHEIEMDSKQKEKTSEDKACPSPTTLYVTEIFKRPQQDEAKCHKDYVSRKEFTELKEEVKRLRRKVREMERQPTTETLPPLPTLPMSLETISTPSSPASTSSLAASPSTSGSTTPTHSSAHMDKDTNLYNGHTFDSLTDSVSHVDNLYTAVRTLLLKLFPEEYIITHSVTGKAPNSKTEKKPPYDFRLFGVLLKITKIKFGSTSKEVTEKVHSVQKSILKSKKQNKK